MIFPRVWWTTHNGFHCSEQCKQLRNTKFVPEHSWDHWLIHNDYTQLSYVFLFFAPICSPIMIDRFLVTKPSRIRRNLMKNCTNIEQDVPYSIPEAPGADSGAKRPKNQKNVTRKFSEKIWIKTKKRARAVCSWPQNLSKYEADRCDSVSRR